jgi:serine/threonine protein kinase
MPRAAGNVVRIPRPGPGAYLGGVSKLIESLATDLAPDLTILRALGSGAVADVYLARETELQRLVAVKVLRPDVAADDVVRRRFEREAQVAARVAHPNVTAIYRIGRLPDGVPYIVMEYVDGRTVSDLLAGGPLEPAVAGPLLASVADALAVAHQRGVVHRDLRPGNIFVDRQTGRAVLADFGIAALLDSGTESAARLTAVGVKLGQIRYMSPEQIRGEPVTPQSDIFAFGVLACEVLTGRGPWGASSDAELLVAHLQQEPTPLRTLCADIDERTATLLQRCLDREPNRRPLAGELAAALAAPVPATAAAAAADDGPLDQFLHELQRRRVYRVLATYGAVALAIFGVMQGVEGAFGVPRTTYRVVVGVTLAGFPLSLVLSWIYDINAGRIQRTRSTGPAERLRPLLWVGLAASVAAAAALGWVLLRGG